MRASDASDGAEAADGVEEATAERTALRDRILEAAFTNAAFDGWTRRTLLASAEMAGIDRATALRLFPRGGDSLVGWIDDWADRRMLELVSAEELARPGIRTKVASLVLARLTALAPHKEAVRRAVIARGMPQNAWTTAESLWRTVDRIWAAAGFPPGAEEGSARLTRRLTLAAVLGATGLFWLQDRSEDDADTAAFLDRRLDGVMRFGKLTGGLQGRFDRLMGRMGRASRPRPAG